MHGLNVIARHAAALLIHPAELVLRGGIALLGAAAIPENGPRVVLLDTAANLKHPTQIVLRGGVS